MNLSIQKIQVHKLRYRFSGNRGSGFGRLLLTFLIILSYFSAPACTVICKGALNVSLPASGEVVITPGILLEDSMCDPADFTVQIEDENGNSIGNTITCAQTGQSLMAGAIHNTNGNSCWTTLHVFDYIPMQLECTDTTISCMNTTYSPEDTGYPEIVDNCVGFNNVDLTFSDEIIDLECLATNGSDTITSKIERTWTATDEKGNTASCLQTIFLKRTTVYEVIFPAHRDGFAKPFLDCLDDPTDLTLTGEPTIDGMVINGAGACELLTSYSDQESDICGSGGYRIFRTWTVIDWCTGEYRLKVQVIKVMDTTAPNITCPGDIQVGTHASDCTADVILPEANATDDCSDFTIEPSWEYGVGQGPFYDVPAGQHMVIYTAEDNCGNSSSCSISVTIADDKIPVMVCKSSIIVSLNNGGIAAVNATSADNGSYDNCTLDFLEVSRDGINYNNIVSFDCNDAFENVVVTLRAVDQVGNTNECDVNVMVKEDESPVIGCPPNAYVECTDDINDLVLTGNAVAIDNCNLDTLYYTDSFDINDCGVGTITRTWRAEDIYGNFRTCKQLIFVENNTPFQVQFPDDYTASTCGASTEVSVTGEPTVIGYSCGSISITHSDNVFNISAPACYKIFRNWIVVDWCTYDPDSGSDEGYYTHSQLITIHDNEAPVLNCFNDTIVGSKNPNCGGTYIELPIPIVTDCSQNISVTNNSLYADANGENASGIYPIGTHSITFTAEDGCGNQTTCTALVTVIDGLAPFVNCLSEITVNISSDSTATITSEMINLGSYDNCSAVEDLDFLVTPNVFSCADLGLQEVELSVTDEMGNTGTCSVTVDVQNNGNICPNTGALLEGRILSEIGSPIVGTTVFLSGDLTGVTTTDEDGFYTFENVPKNGNYTILPIKDGNDLNGVNTLDLILMSMHILGMQRFDSPYKVIASDANASNSTTSFDMVDIRKLLLLIDLELGSLDSWRFIDAAYEFNNPNFPLSEAFPESITVTNLSTDIFDLDFLGVKIGDVNNNHNPGQLHESDTRNESDLFWFETKDIHLEKGNIYTIPLTINNLNNLAGLQYTLEANPDFLEIIELEYTETANELGMKDNNFGFTKQAAGVLTSSWVNIYKNTTAQNAHLFNLKVKCLKSTRLSNVFNINSAIIKAESYFQKGTEMPITSDFKIKFKATDNNKKDVELLGNFPNPFQTITTISFVLSKPASGKITIVDAIGRILKVVAGEFEYGVNEVTLQKSDLSVRSGTLIYQLELEGMQQKTGKMLLIER